MHLFTAGRDYRPQAVLADIPPEANYIRVLVYAPDMQRAQHALDDAGLSRYVQLRKPTSSDGPAEAISVHLHLHLMDLIEQHPVFVVYTARRGRDGIRHKAPRFYALHLRGADLVPLGRVRVVGMGLPTAPAPIVRIVADDGADDAVAMRPETEGPGPDTSIVEGVLPYPSGRLGAVVTGRDWDLTQNIADLRDRLSGLIEEVDRCRTSEDPTRAWMRASGPMRSMASELFDLAATAELVETALQYGTD